MEDSLRSTITPFFKTCFILIYACVRHVQLWARVCLDLFDSFRGSPQEDGGPFQQ